MSIEPNVAVQSLDIVIMMLIRKFIKWSIDQFCLPGSKNVVFWRQEIPFIASYLENVIYPLCIAVKLICISVLLFCFVWLCLVFEPEKS